MTSVAELRLLITGKDDASAVLKGVRGETDGLGKSVGGIGTIAGGVLAAGAIKDLGRSVSGFFGDAIEGATKLELQGKKASVVFGDELGDVEKWAKENAHAMGLTSSEMLGLAANTADLLIPMGLTREEAVGLTKDELGLAGALAEWTGGEKDAAEVSEILTKAYLGETDGLKALGISISAADIEARLLEKGQKKLTGQQLAQARATAIQELIFEKSTDAQTAYAEGSGSAARKQAELKAAQRELSDEMKQKLVPVLTTGLELFTAMPEPLQLIGAGLFSIAPQLGQLAVGLGAAGPLLSGLGPAFTAAAAGAKALGLAMLTPPLGIIIALAAVGVAIYIFRDDIIGAVSAVVNYVKPAVAGLSSAITGSFQEVLDFGKENWPEIATLISGPFAPVTLLATDAFGVRTATIGGLQETIDWTKENWPEMASILSGPFLPITAIAFDAWGVRSNLEGAFDAMFDKATGWGADITSFFTGLPSAFSTAFGDGFGFLWEAFRSSVNKMITGWNSLSFSIPGVDTHIPKVGTIGGFTLSTPDVPLLAQGLWRVPGPRGAGDIFPALLTPGEMVVPARQADALRSGGGGGLGGDINITFSGDIHPVTQAKEPRDLFRDVSFAAASELRRRGIWVPG